MCIEAHFFFSILLIKEMYISLSTTANCNSGSNRILDPSFSVMSLPTVDTFATGWYNLSSESRMGFDVCATMKTYVEKRVLETRREYLNRCSY